MLIIIIMILFFIWAGYRGFCFKIEDYCKKKTSKSYQEFKEKLERIEQKKREEIAVAQPPIAWEDLCIDRHSEEDNADYFE